jgi:hypothetical protein
MKHFFPAAIFLTLALPAAFAVDSTVKLALGYRLGF